MTDEPHPCDGLPDGAVEFLSQPLTTDEGLPNAAAFAELECALARMPRLRPDLRDDPEWNLRTWTGAGDIVGSFAGWAVHLMTVPCDLETGTFPPRFEEVIGVLNAEVRRWEPMQLLSGVWMGNVSLVEIHDWLWLVLEDLEAFNAWNDDAVVGECWIDLCALITGTVGAIKRDRRHAYAFDRKFEREHGGAEQ